MKSIMITGGAGFIGQHLMRALLPPSKDLRVYIVDNFSTSLLSAKDFVNGHGNVLYQVADVADPQWLQNWRSAHWIGEVEEIYHLACPASPLHYQKTPVETLRTALLGTMHVLEIAKTLKCKVLIASTSEIYGDPMMHPQKENYWGNVNPIGSRSCYDEGKRAGESLAFAYQEQHGVDVRVARIFNTYGPGMHPSDGRLLPNLIMQALKKEPITIYGDGKQTRSFCYVDDTVRGLMAIMKAAPRSSFVPVFNVGNPDERTIFDVAMDVLNMSVFVPPVFKTLPKDDPTRRCPDISKIKNELGWIPVVSFSEGLRNTYNWFKTQV